MDDGILLPLRSEEPRYLEDIDGPSENSIFLVGWKGFLRWFDGRSWAKIDVPTKEDLYAIYVENADNIWICGRNGTLLKGNERSGFTDLSSIFDNDTFLSIAPYQGKIYLGTQSGVSVFDGHSITPVDTG